MGPPNKKYIQKMQALRRYHTDFEWILPDWFLLYEDKYSKGIISNNFELEGTNGCICQLCLTPKNSESHLSFKLSDSQSIMAMNLTILINKQNQNKYDFYKPNFETCRLEMSVPYDKKKKPDALDKEALTILVKFVIVSSPKTCISKNSSLNVPKKKKVTFFNNTVYDITFVFGDQTLVAHKNILAAQSIVFQRMFMSQLTEEENTTIQIVDIKAKVFKEFINYLYTGEINHLNNMVEDLIVVANKYQVTELKKICENYMLLNLDAANVVKYIFIADNLCCAELKKESVNLLKNSASLLTKVIQEENIKVIKSLKKILSDSSQDLVNKPFFA